MKFFFEYKGLPFSAVYDQGQDGTFDREGFEEHIYDIDCENEEDAGLLYSEIEEIEQVAWEHLRMEGI